MVAAVWTALLAIAPLVRFIGGSGCPAPAEAEVRLEALMPDARPQATSDVATVEELGERLRVTLRRADGTTLGTRELDRFQSCDDLAAAIALVVATWESDVHPEFVSTVPAQTPSPRPPAGPDRPAFDVGAAAVASAAPARVGAWGEGFALGASVVGGWVPRRGRPGARLALLAGTERVLPVGTGEAHWRRLTAAVGSQIRWGRPGGPAAVDVHVALLVAALSLRGAGFAINQTAWSLDLGAGAGARLWLGRGWARPWLELGVAAWPRQQVVYQTPDDGQASLPRVDIMLALGLGFLGPQASPRKIGD